MSAATILSCAAESTEVPKVTVGPFYTLKSNGNNPNMSLISVRDDACNEPIFIMSNEFDMARPARGKDGQLMFVRSREDDRALHSVITELEEEVNRQLREERHNIRNLPDNVKNQLDRPDSLRPNYNNDGTAFFRSVPGCAIYNWMGSEKIEESALGRGRYQFILKASSVYVGSHRDGHPTSLLLKIVQIRHLPCPTVKVEQTTFMFQSTMGTNLQQEVPSHRLLLQCTHP